MSNIEYIIAISVNNYFFFFPVFFPARPGNAPTPPAACCGGAVLEDASSVFPDLDGCSDTLLATSSNSALPAYVGSIGDVLCVY